MNRALADAVVRQYERYPYPSPVEDLSSTGPEWFDPSHAHRIFWPGRDYKSDLDILIAGCGTNQAARFALYNPDAKIVGVDVSQRSLNHEQYLKDKYKLLNLELHRLPIEEVSTLRRDFDLIVSTGVLHHLADPAVGMKALAGCLRRDAVLAVMLYGRYGRIGVDMVESIFRDLGLGRDEPSIEAAQKMFQSLPPNHPVQSYLKASVDPQTPGDPCDADVWMIDTFLHGRQRTYTVEECVDLVNSVGLLFQGWLNKAPYYPHELFTSGDALSSAVSDLTDEVKIWSVMERIHTLTGHPFISCRPDRPKHSYLIDFSTPQALDYIPQWRKGCGFSGNTIFRPGGQMNLQEDFYSFVEHVDGRRTIQETARASGSPEKLGLELFKGLWHLDFFTLAIPSRL